MEITYVINMCSIYKNVSMVIYPYRSQPPDEQISDIHNKHVKAKTSRPINVTSLCRCVMASASVWFLEQPKRFFFFFPS